MKTARKVVFGTVLAAVVVGQGALLAGCNTTEGFGQDVKNTGTAIKKSAENTKEKM